MRDIDPLLRAAALRPAGGFNTLQAAARPIKIICMPMLETSLRGKVYSILRRQAG